ncbi:MAG: synthase subunit epsilon [Bacteroidota bacterium]|jgi:F-type H+-transporting ATPase subunit epsilon
MHLHIITPDKSVFEGNAELVQLPGTDGLFELLNNHAPIIATLKKGTIRVKPEKEAEKSFQITGGVLEAQQNKVVVLVESVL